MRDSGDGATGRRDLVKTVGRSPGAEDNGAVGTPAAAAAGEDIGERNDGAAAGVDLFELTFCKEADG